MDAGQVGFKRNKDVRRTVVVERDRELIRRLERTKREAHNDPAELRSRREARDRAEREAAKRGAKQSAQEAKAEAQRWQEEKEARSYDRLGLDDEEKKVSNAAASSALEKLRLEGKSEAEACRDLEDDFM